MTSLKYREVKGKRYLYLSHSFTYRGEKMRFEKVVGRADAPREMLNERAEILKDYLRLKELLYRVYVDTKKDRLRYIPQDYSFFLSLVKHTYSDYLKHLYPEEVEKYLSEFNIRHVHNTTAIEGNTLNLRETALILKEGIAPSGATLREIYEVENYKRVLQYVDSYRGDIDRRFILKLHMLIERNIDDEHAGSFRRIEVGIEGSPWEPPPAIVVEEEIDELLNWYGQMKGELHPVELAGIFHHRFLQIHPFVDGNGRVARELLNFILRRNGFPPVIIPVKEREEYMIWLAEADRGRVRGLLEFLSALLIKEHLAIVLRYLGRESPGAGVLKIKDVRELVRLFSWFFKLMHPCDIQPPDYLMKKILNIKELIPHPPPEKC